MTSSTVQDTGLDIIVDLINRRFDDFDKKSDDRHSQVLARLDRQDARIDAIEPTALAVKGEREAAAEQRAQLETARLSGRRGLILGVFGAGLASVSAVMNYGHAVADVISRAFGGH